MSAWQERVVKQIWATFASPLMAYVGTLTVGPAQSTFAQYWGMTTVLAFIMLTVCVWTGVFD